MSVFAVQYAYVDRPEALTEVRPRHREFLAGLLAEGTLLASGPYVGGPAGALLLVRAESAESAALLLEEDPFFVAGLIEGRSVRGWLPVMGPIPADVPAADVQAADVPAGVPAAAPAGAPAGAPTESKP